MIKWKSSTHVLTWIGLVLFLTGCSHLQPPSQTSGPEAPEPSAAKENAAATSCPAPFVTDITPADPAPFLTEEDEVSAGAAEVIKGDISQDLAEPLEKEVIEPPPDEAVSRQLSPQEKEALKTEPEINFELDIRENKTLQNYFVYYSQKKRKTFQRWLKRAEPYLPYIRQVFTEKGLPQDLVFLPFAESGFNPWAYSHAGAAGMWQFIPGTGRRYGLRVDWWIDERRDPYLATHAAADYLSKLYDQFHDWYLVLAAYNAGEGRVAWALRKSGKDCYFDLINSRRYLHRETRNYVPKFLAILKIVRNLEKLGFAPLEWDADVQPTRVEVKGGTDLLALAQTMGLDWSDFRQQNPAFRRMASPPDKSCPVYVPRDKKSLALNFLDSPQARPYAGFTRHRIRTGDSWWRLSRRYGVPIRVLKRINQTSSNLLRPGQSVLIPGSGSKAARVQPSNPPKNGVYTVRSGDSLWDIATRFGTQVSALRRANNLSSNTLQIGQKLSIPGLSGQAQTRSIARRRANYTIQKGDTLWDLSRRFGVSLATLVQANGLNQSATLQVGSGLYIPDLTHAQAQKTRQQAKAAHQKLVRYRVRKGDNIWNIARKFGVRTRQLLAWNDLSPHQLIHPGDQLKVYVD